MLYGNLRLNGVKTGLLTAFAAVLLAATVFFGLRKPIKSADTSVSADVTAPGEYLASFGFSFEEPVKDKITVPYVFEAVYENYNAIQRSQGFDLSKYKGKTLTRYTYQLLEENRDDRFAEILLCGDLIVGADIYSVGFDGEMTALK